MDVVCTGASQSADALSTFVPDITAACGITFTIDDAGPWDVRTDAAGNVLDHHRNVTCPDCGTATFVIQP